MKTFLKPQSFMQEK